MAIELDQRTHRYEDVGHLSPAAFFGERLPALIAAHGQLVAQAMKVLQTRPITIEIEGEWWSIAVNDDTIEALPTRVDGALVIHLSAAEFSDWCQNQRSLNAFMVARTLRPEAGDERDISIWDSLTLTLLYGWPTVGEVEFSDRNGLPLDLDQFFTPDDDPADIAHFVRETGFLHLRGWVDPALMPRISADMDRVVPTHVEGDGSSWWAQLTDGTRVCVRLQEFVQHSEATVEMLSSQRWNQLRLAIAGHDDLVQAPIEGRCIEALLKPVGVVSGPSDLSFHRDCHLGRHAYGCSGVTVGVSVTDSHPDNGQLQVIPGSHRIAMPVEIARHNPTMAVHPLSTQAGDLTVHLSCTLHEATAPLFDERRVMYAGFDLGPRDGAGGRGDDALAALREQVTNLLREDAGTGA